MAADGDTQRAESILTAHPGGNSQALHDATLARVYRREGRNADAAAIYFKLQQAKNLDAGTIREAAEFFGAQHDLAAAHQWLDRLGALALAPGQRELMLADFEEGYGDPQAATKLYEDAVKAGGDDPTPALAQIGYLIRRQQWASAKSATDAAVARWPNNPALANVKSAQDIFAASADVRRLAPLLVAISLEPQNEAGSQTLRVMADAATANPTDTVKKLQDLLAKYPDFEPLYSLTISRLLALGRADDAQALAATVVARFGQSASAAQTATDAYIVTGDWTDAMVAAREWRQRDPDHPGPADRLIATADLYLDQPRDAVDRLAPYISDAKTRPDLNRDILIIYTQALIRTGDEAGAIALLQPLADHSPAWRAAWLKMAAFAHTDGVAAAAWIEQIRPKLDPNSIVDQQELADAYLQCALVRGYSQGFQIAYDTLKPFVSSAGATVPALATFAGAAAGIHDRQGAEQAYRQILKIDPNLAGAQNNLADFLRQNGDMSSLKEGEALIRSTIAANPSDPNLANFYDTLARILLAQGRVNDAIAAFDAGNHIQPKNMSLLVGLAYACAKSGRLEAAGDYLAQIDTLVLAGQKVPPELQPDLDAARVAAKKTDARNSVTGTDLSPTAK
jgi:tetratricopeptide (TPR) repeat protein